MEKRELEFIPLCTVPDLCRHIDIHNNQYNDDPIILGEMMTKLINEGTRTFEEIKKLCYKGVCYYEGFKTDMIDFLKEMPNFGRAFGRRSPSPFYILLWKTITAKSKWTIDIINGMFTIVEKDNDNDYYIQNMTPDEYIENEIQKAMAESPVL